MSNMRMKHKLIMSMMAGMIIIPGSVVRTQAAETDDSEKSLVPVTGIENILEASYQTEIKNNINLYLVPTEEGEYLNIAFSNTGDYTYIRSEADENSEWVGKLYSSEGDLRQYRKPASAQRIRHSLIESMARRPIGKPGVLSCSAHL